MSSTEQVTALSGLPAAKARFAAELAVGDAVDDLFYLREATERTTHGGETYLALLLSDRSGVIEGRVWAEDARRLAGDLRPGGYFRVRGIVAGYRGQAQVNVRQAEPQAGEAVATSDFLPSSYRDSDELIGFLRYFVSEVYDQDFQRLLESFYDDGAFIEQFRTAPGDARTHHAYLGGLLEHTVSVATLCQHVAVQHPRINADLLITAALLHDVGKIEEFVYEGTIGFSAEGRLLGHVLLGQRMIEKRIRELGSFPREKELRLVHALISHHGELEWGAPKRPQSVEALVLHHIDNLDAKVKGFLEVVTGRGEVSWPKLQNLFRRPLDMPLAAEGGG